MRFLIVDLFIANPFITYLCLKILHGLPRHLDFNSCATSYKELIAICFAAATGYHSCMIDSSLPSIPDLVQQLADKLLAKKLIMATAESCTGGWIAQSLTALAGSSDWFDTGFVTYSNAAKQRLLNVPASIFEADGPGAVGVETVLAMTAGAIANSRANVAVAVSGIAGPSGGSEEKPVGTVWIAWQWEDQAHAKYFQFSGDREAVRLAAVVAALQGTLELLD